MTFCPAGKRSHLPWIGRVADYSCRHLIWFRPNGRTPRGPCAHPCPSAAIAIAVRYTLLKPVMPLARGTRSGSGAILSAAVLFYGSLQAPFLHIHPEDLDHSPNTAVFHIHLHEVPVASAPVISARTADDDAIEVAWNALQCSYAGLVFDLELAQVTGISAPLNRSVPISAPDRRAHAPPCHASTHPRAPPA